MAMVSVGGYEIFFRRDNSVEFVLTGVFPVDSLDLPEKLPKYHGGTALFCGNFGRVYTSSRIAGLLPGPVCMYAGDDSEKKLGVVAEPGAGLEYLLGVGVHQDFYYSLKSRESSLKFHCVEKMGGGLTLEMKLKKVVLRPLPVPAPETVSKIIPDFFDNP